METKNFSVEKIQMSVKTKLKRLENYISQDSSDFEAPKPILAVEFHNLGVETFGSFWKFIRYMLWAHKIEINAKIYAQLPLCLWPKIMRDELKK